MRPRLGLAIPIAILIAGCTGGGLAGPSQGQGPTVAATPLRTSAATPGHTDQNQAFDMCALMPGGEVASAAPFTIPFKGAESMNSSSPGCVYSFEGDRDFGSILLVVTAFGTAADALTWHRNVEEVAVDRGSAIQQISGLGDTASAFGQDEVGVHAVLGNRVIDANFKGQWPDVTDASKVAAGTALIRTIISRLP